MSKYAQYLVCKERGHTPSGYTLASIPPKQVCKFCGAYFWTELVRHEINVPKEDE